MSRRRQLDDLPQLCVTVALPGVESDELDLDLDLDVTVCGLSVMTLAVMAARVRLTDISYPCFLHSGECLVRSC